QPLAYEIVSGSDNNWILRLHPVAANHPGSTQLADQRPEAAHPASAEGQPVPTVPGPAAASGAGVVEGPTGGANPPADLTLVERTGSPSREAASHNSAGAPAGGLAAPVELRDLAVRQEAGGLAIEFLLSGPVTPRLSRLDSPARVVVDLPKTVAVTSQRRIAMESGGAKVVRVGVDRRHVPPITRVVVDLAQPLAYEIVSGSDNNWILRLHPVAANHPGSTQLADQRPEAAHPASAEGQPVPTVPGPAAASGAGVVAGPTGGNNNPILQPQAVPANRSGSIQAADQHNEPPPPAIEAPVLPSVSSAPPEVQPAPTVLKPATSKVTGLVEDRTGAVIPEADVTLTDQANGRALNTVADETGHFAFRQVAPGKYHLRVETQGFEAVELPLEVGAHPTPAQRVRLQPANVSEEITVSARATADPLSSDQNASAVTLTEDGLLRGLPTNRAEPLAIASLFVDPAANDAQGTKIIVDGVEDNGVDVPVSSIKAIAVDRNPYSAEFGRPGKGRIEVTTRSGSTHRFHKRFEFTARDASMDARNYFATVNPPRSREWLEGEVDGPLPLFANKATFVLSGDYLRDNNNNFVNAVTPLGRESDTVPTHRRTAHLLEKTTVRLNSLNTLSLGYTFSLDRYGNQGVGGFDLPERGWSSNKRTHELRIQETATPTSAFLNQVLLDFRYRPKQSTSGTDAPAILVNGAFNTGGAQIWQSTLEREAEFQDLASYIHGKHSFRFGGLVKSRFIGDTDRSNFGGTFTFSDNKHFLNHSPLQYTVNQGDPRATFAQHEIAYFLQDEIRLRPQINLLLGLRHEFQSNLGYHKNLAPRIALSAATPSGRTVLRAGVGVFYQRQPVSLEEQYLHLNGAERQIVLKNPGFPSPGNLNSSPPSVLQIEPHIRAPYNIQASLSVEQKLATQTSLTAEYTMLRGSRLYRLRDINAPLSATGPRPNPNFVTINQFETAGSSHSHSFALGVRTKLRRLQLLARYTFSHSIDDTSGLSFLPADSYDLRGERGSSEFDQRHRLNVAGVLKLPHGFNFGLIGSWHSGIPYNITTGFDDNGDTIVNDRPSLGNPNAPFNSFGVDGSFVGGKSGALYDGLKYVSGGTLFPLSDPNSVRWLILPEPGNVGRNVGHGPGGANMDLRFTKKFMLRRAKSKSETTREVEFRLDVFDFLNQTNFQNFVGTLTSPHFGKPIKAYSSRELQPSLRVSF
ncbi:MAG: hypothetical protein DMG69_00165, partial [Acidobacteria bacterium]